MHDMTRNVSLLLLLAVTLLAWYQKSNTCSKTFFSSDRVDKFSVDI